VSRHRREWRATVTSSCARLLVLCAAFYFSALGQAAAALLCRHNPAVGVQSISFFIIIIREIYLHFASQECHRLYSRLDSPCGQWSLRLQTDLLHATHDINCRQTNTPKTLSVSLVGRRSIVSVRRTTW
jgi:hypothetical protein